MSEVWSRDVVCGWENNFLLLKVSNKKSANQGHPTYGASDVYSSQGNRVPWMCEGYRMHQCVSSICDRLYEQTDFKQFKALVQGSAKKCYRLKCEESGHRWSVCCRGVSRGHRSLLQSSWSPSDALIFLPVRPRVVSHVSLSATTFVCLQLYDIKKKQKPI